jgi:alanine-synthesizing transaminase
MKTFHDPEVFARVRRLPVYVFTITDRLRDEAIARGVDVVDLSMGNPDRGASWSGSARRPATRGCTAT